MLHMEIKWAFKRHKYVFYANIYFKNATVMKRFRVVREKVVKEIL